MRSKVKVAEAASLAGALFGGCCNSFGKLDKLRQ